MPQLKEYYHDVDLKANQLFNSRLHNITTAARVALGLGLTTQSKGYMVYDTDLSTPYFWDGTQWLAAGGSSTWGSITGTLTAQTDLITYLSTNYYPVTNPAGYITSLALSPYITSATAASTYVPLSRNLTINGTTYDLSADRTWTVSGLPSQSGHAGEWLTTDGTNASWASLPPSGVSAVTATSPLFSSGGATPDITIQQASGSQDGYLSSADWTTFNNKLGSIPSLQDVTTVGAITDKNMTIQNGTPFFTVTDGGTAIARLGVDSAANYSYLKLQGNNSAISVFDALIYPSTSLTANRSYMLPNKSGTFAMTSDIPTVTPSALTKVNDTNVTLTLGGSPSTALLQATSLTLGWTGTLADSRIASASIWNAKQNAITLTTTGTSGAATFISNTLNIPQYQAVLTNPVTGTGVATRIAFWSGTSALSSNSNLYWDDVNSYLGISNIIPVAPIDLGSGTGTAGSISKIALYSSPTYGTYGFGISPAQLDYVSGGAHVFYRNSPTTDELFRIGNTGTLTSLSLVGSGTRMMVADSGGIISATTIPTIPTKTSELTNDGDNGYTHFISLEDLPSNLVLYATNVASGISTYTKAVSSLTDPDFNAVAVNIPVGPLTSTTIPTYCGGIVSSANIIVGNPGIFTMSTIGNIRRTSGTAEGVFYYEVYKRDSGGTETLIVTSANTFPVSSNVYVEFNAAALFNNGVFTATDRIVIKFYGLRLVGGSNPSFDFQFGGVAPVRTTLPIPLTVTPLPREIIPVSTNTNAGSVYGIDYIYLVSGTTTITLPTAVGNVGIYNIKRVGTGVVSIATTSSQTIDGSASPITINVQYVSLTLVSDGANWNII